MIITRSPLRITLGGGGTDLPSYYEDHGGFVISAAIDKYVYITLHQTFVQELIVKYSQMERVNDVNEIAHPIIREVLNKFDLRQPHLELTSMADIPSGTGLGSSSSFTTALLKALHCLRKSQVSPQELAEEACHIEMEKLREPIGKQDQYIAAYGGITCFEFCHTGEVKSTPLNISDETFNNLEDNLMLFFTGYSRSASSILSTQDKLSKSNDVGMIDNLHFVKELGLKSKLALEEGDLKTFSNIMNIHWEHKKKRSDMMSNSKIDDWYRLGLDQGALGGKMIGAGGGGFLMFYAEDKNTLRKAMLNAGLKEVRFRFDFQGTQVVAQS